MRRACVVGIARSILGLGLQDLVGLAVDALELVLGEIAFVALLCG
jgi:hypothetical protein